MLCSSSIPLFMNLDDVITQCLCIMSATASLIARDALDPGVIAEVTSEPTIVSGVYRTAEALGIPSYKLPSPVRQVESANGFTWECFLYWSTYMPTSAYPYTMSAILNPWP